MTKADGIILISSSFSERMPSKRGMQNLLCDGWHIYLGQDNFPRSWGQLKQWCDGALRPQDMAIRSSPDSKLSSELPKSLFVHLWNGPDNTFLLLEFLQDLMRCLWNCPRNHQRLLVVNQGGGQASWTWETCTGELGWEATTREEPGPRHLLQMQEKSWGWWSGLRHQRAMSWRACRLGPDASIWSDLCVSLELQAWPLATRVGIAQLKCGGGSRGGIGYLDIVVINLNEAKLKHS